MVENRGVWGVPSLEAPLTQLEREVKILTIRWTKELAKASDFCEHLPFHDKTCARAVIHATGKVIAFKAWIVVQTDQLGRAIGLNPPTGLLKVAAWIEDP